MTTGCAIALEIKCWLQLKGSPYQIYGGQSTTGIGFSMPVFISPIHSTHPVRCATCVMSQNIVMCLVLCYGFSF